MNSNNEYNNFNFHSVSEEELNSCCSNISENYIINKESFSKNIPQYQILIKVVEIYPHLDKMYFIINIRNKMINIDELSKLYFMNVFTLKLQ